MRQHIKGLLAAASLLAVGVSAHASDWRKDVDLSRADLSMMKLVMMNEGKKAGRMEYEWRRESDTYVIEDLTEMQPNIFETAKGVIDAKSLQPQSVYVDFAMGTSKMLIDLGWQADHMTGAITISQEGKDDNVTKADARVTAPLRLSVFGLISGLPLAADYSVELPWFNSMANRTENITLKVEGEETVETPAGTFDTYKVAIRGGSPENYVYVTKSLPRKTVRIDVVGRPMHFLRIE